MQLLAKHSLDTSSVLLELVKAYLRDPEMSDKLKEFARETVDKLLRETPPEELRKHLSPQQRLEGLPAEERLKGLSVDDVLKGLDPETLKALVSRLKSNGST